jgi:hypothetical protein
MGVCEGFAIVSAKIQDDWAVEWPPTERPLSSYPQPCVAAVDDILAGEYADVFLGKCFWAEDCLWSCSTATPRGNVNRS